MLMTVIELPSAETASGGSPPGGTPGTQPLENIGVLFKETPGADDVSDDGNNEFQFEEAGQLFETDETASPEINGAEETKTETLEADEAEQENLAERLLKRKSPIDSTDENPAYQKSIDDLQDSSESGSGDPPQ